MLRSGACRRFRECGNVVYANVIKDEAGELRAHEGRAERPVVMQCAGLRSVAQRGVRRAAWAPEQQQHGVYATAAVANAVRQQQRNLGM